MASFAFQHPLSWRLIALPWLALLCALLVSGCSGAGKTADQAYGFLESSRPEAAETLELELAGRDIAVRLTFPQGYNNSRRWPVCVVLRATNNPLLPDMRRAAAQKGFILALADIAPDAPAAPDEGREAPALQEVLPFVDRLLNLLRGDYAADHRRITLYGMGEDADLASRLACARSHRIAGLALVDGGTPPPDCRPVKPVPTIVLSSTPQATGGVASFWASNNGCESIPATIRKNGLEYERYTCPMPLSAVQRYLAGGSGDQTSALQAFPPSWPAAWTVFEFLLRQSDQ